MDIIYYGELDPYSGSIRPTPHDFLSLVTELKFLVMFSERVILPTENMIHHPLALPAFEYFEPFVKSGILGTSTSNPKQARSSFLNRIDATAEQLLLSNNKHIREVRTRWKTVLPDSWSIKRNIEAQKQGGLSILSRLLLDDRINRTNVESGLEFIKQVKNFNDLPDRTNLMEIVASNASLLSQPELYNIQLAIQSSYFRMGSIQKFNLDNTITDIKHFPGGFYRTHKQFLNRLPDTVSPKYAIELSPDFIETKLEKFFGVNLAQLLSLSVDELFTLRSLPEWISLKNVLKESQYNEVELSSEPTKVHLSEKRLLDYLLQMSLDISAELPNGLKSVPSAVQNVIRGGLGWPLSSNSYGDNGDSIRYNCNTGTISSYLDGDIELSSRLIPYMNLLTMKGRVGILPIEFELLESIHISRPGFVRPRMMRYVSVDESNKVNAKKKRNDLKRLLVKIGLSVEKISGLWYLSGPEIHVFGSPESNVFSYPSMPNLPPQLFAAFLLIAEAPGQRVSKAYLQNKLSEENYDVGGQYRISKLVSLLNLHLEQQCSPYKVSSRQRGYLSIIETR